MLRLGLLLFTMTLLVSCSSKKELILKELYSKNMEYHKYLLKTEKIQLYEDNTTKVLLTATYLTAIKEKNTTLQDEQFIVGVHLEDEEYNHIQNSGYMLTLNNKNIKSVERLSTNDKRLDSISFKTEWGSYYLITFPYIESKKMMLCFKTEKYGEKKIFFSKVAKYVFTKKGF